MWCHSRASSSSPRPCGPRAGISRARHATRKESPPGPSHAPPVLGRRLPDEPRVNERAVKSSEHDARHPSRIGSHFDPRVERAAQPMVQRAPRDRLQPQALLICRATCRAPLAPRAPNGWAAQSSAHSAHRRDGGGALDAPIAPGRPDASHSPVRQPPHEALHASSRVASVHPLPPRTAKGAVDEPTFSARAARPSRRLPVLRSLAIGSSPTRFARLRRQDGTLATLCVRPSSAVMSATCRRRSQRTTPCPPAWGQVYASSRSRRPWRLGPLPSDAWAVEGVSLSMAVPMAERPPTRPVGPASPPLSGPSASAGAPRGPSPRQRALHEMAMQIGQRLDRESETLLGAWESA